MLKLILTGVFACWTFFGDTIVQNTGGSSGVVNEFFGQSFTTPAGRGWFDIAFNFYSDIPAVTPVADGIAFLLSQEYLGAPAGLDSNTRGFIAKSTSVSGSRYVFPCL